MKRDPYHWSTEGYHHDNSFTMNDYIDNEMDISWEAEQYGTSAEIMDDCGNIYLARAAGNGDSFNHVITFELLN